MNYVCWKTESEPDDLPHLTPVTTYFPLDLARSNARAGSLRGFPLSPFFTVEGLSQRPVHSGRSTAADTDLNVTNVYLEIQFR